MSDSADAAPARHGRGPSRRDVLVGGSAGAGMGLLGLFGGSTIASRSTSASSVPDLPETPASVPSRGRHQAGIARPETPQRNCLIAVADLDGDPSRDQALTAIAAAGDAIDALTSGTNLDALPDGPGDVTVSIGIGPRLVRAINPGLPGAQPLPAFAGDDAMAPSLVGGDLLVAVYSSDAAACRPAADAVVNAISGATLRWAQVGTRGAGEGTVVRNPLGYHDGIKVPRNEAELNADVWIGDGPAADGTVAVIRRLRIDVEGFRALDAQGRDAVVGRSRQDGAPLSGGSLMDDVNLLAKSPEGEYLIPQHAHVRAAHPSFTGSPLMLRRSYGYSNAVEPGAVPDDGVIFMCFQNDLDVFVRTQQRLDEQDDLMKFAQATASASFLIVPGRDGNAPLGARLA